MNSIAETAVGFSRGQHMRAMGAVGAAGGLIGVVGIDAGANFENELAHFIFPVLLTGTGIAGAVKGAKALRAATSVDAEAEAGFSLSAGLAGGAVAGTVLSKALGLQGRVSASEGH